MSVGGSVRNRSSLSGSGSIHIEGVGPQGDPTSSSTTEQDQLGSSLTHGGVTAGHEARAQNESTAVDRHARLATLHEQKVQENEKLKKEPKGKEREEPQRARTFGRRGTFKPARANVREDQASPGIPKYKRSRAMNPENTPQWLKDLDQDDASIGLLGYEVKKSTTWPEYRYFTDKKYQALVHKFAAEQREFLETDLSDDFTLTRLGAQLAVILQLREPEGGAITDSMREARHAAGASIYWASTLSNFVSAMTSFVPGFSLSVAGLLVSNPIVLGSVTAGATLISGYVLTKLPAWQTNWHVRGVKERDFKLFPFAAPGVESRKYIDPLMNTLPLRPLRAIEEEVAYAQKLAKSLGRAIESIENEELLVVAFKDRLSKLVDEVEELESAVGTRQKEIIQSAGALSAEERDLCRTLLKKEAAALRSGGQLPAAEKKQLNKLLSTACAAIGADDFLSLLAMDVKRQFLQSILSGYKEGTTPQEFLAHVKAILRDREIQKRVHKANKQINHGQLSVESRQVRGGLNAIANLGGTIASGASLGDALHGAGHTFTTFQFDPKALGAASSAVTGLVQPGVYGLMNWSGAEADMTARITALTEMLVLMGPANLYLDRTTKTMSEEIQPANLNSLVTSAPEVRMKGIAKWLDFNAQVAAAKLSTWTLPPPGEEPAVQWVVGTGGSVVRYTVESHVQAFAACKKPEDARKLFTMLTAGRTFSEAQKNAVHGLIDELFAWNKLKAAATAFDLETLLLDRDNLLQESAKKTMYMSIKYALETMDNQKRVQDGESPIAIPQEWAKADLALASLLADIDLAMLPSWEEYAQKFGMQFLYGGAGPGSIQAIKLPFTAAAGIATAVHALPVAAGLNIAGNALSTLGSLFSIPIAAQQDAHTALKLVHLNRNEELNLPAIIHTGVNEEFNDKDARAKYGHVDPARFAYFGSTKQANEAVGPGNYEVPIPVSLFDDCVAQMFTPRLDPRHYFGGFAKQNASASVEALQHDLYAAQTMLELQEWRDLQDQEAAAAAAAAAAKRAQSKPVNVVSDSEEGYSGDVSEQSDSEEGQSDDEPANTSVQVARPRNRDLLSDAEGYSSDGDNSDLSDSETGEPDKDAAPGPRRADAQTRRSSPGARLSGQNVNLANLPTTLTSNDTQLRTSALEEVRKLALGNQSEDEYAQFCDQLLNISPVAAWGMLARWGSSPSYDDARQGGLDRAFDSLSLSQEASSFLIEVEAEKRAGVLSDEVDRALRSLLRNGSPDEIVTVAEMLLVGSFLDHCRDLLQDWNPQSDDMRQRKSILLETLDRA